MTVYYYSNRSPLTPISQLGGAYRLINQHGERVSDKTLLGKPALYFFGFTHCPDVCPTTLWELSRQVKALNAGDKINIIFVTTDPERDTPQALREYLQAIDPRIIGLTGTQEEIKEITKAFRVYYRKSPLESGGYSIDHTANVFVANAKGQVVMTIGYGESAEMIQSKLQRLLRN